ncbi:hypothetical protein J1C56_02255 [Aminobacter anthyllidis]|uniref:Uncharacterized protein n=1 Tax=Aminobacter anthyllidis TaxID=1035067 RepID=A0A9X1A6Z8_9HYPH|nr:hypothetical protein [Aminobacter anthyllidis]MBT1154407.1 hypothetical protein [Aminobacter anthyllidis]
MVAKIKTVCIAGSWGELTVSANTGRVISYDHQGTLPDPDGETGYSDIVRVDLDEWRKTYPREEPQHLDVLDVGAWTSGGEYVPPEVEWRKDIRGVEA